MSDLPTVGPFEPPPTTFTDGAGREITIRALRPEDRPALVAMYDDFDPAERAQGLPPVGEGPIRTWLETLLDDEEACNVVAWHEEHIVGHATLVPDDDAGHELAIFVHQDHQGAGIGTRLMAALLGYGAANGVNRVWLTVERWNRPAIQLYEKIGFERVDTERFATEMAATLAPPLSSG